jgi:spore coat protein U-like protein
LDISVDVLATPAGKFLVHGTYTDTIMVTLTPTT